MERVPRSSDCYVLWKAAARLRRPWVPRPPEITACPGVASAQPDVAAKDEIEAHAERVRGLLATTGAKQEQAPGRPPTEGGERRRERGGKGPGADRSLDFESRRPLISSSRDTRPLPAQARQHTRRLGTPPRLPALSPEKDGQVLPRASP